MKDQKERIYKMSFAAAYPLYITKAERKGRSKTEVDEIIKWLTGYTSEGIVTQVKNNTDFEHFFLSAPCLHSLRTEIKGVICGIRVEEIEDEIVRNVRYLDKLIDELAKGREMSKILRS